MLIAVARKRQGATVGYDIAHETETDGQRQRGRDRDTETKI